MHNTVYAYDADQEKKGPDGHTLPLWATWLGQPRKSGKDIDMWSTNDPEWGILEHSGGERRPEDSICRGLAR